MKKIKKFLRFIVRKLNRVLFHFFYAISFLFPLKEDQVFCESFFGRQCSDSPRALGDELSARGYNVIYSRTKKAKVDRRINKTYRNSLKYFYYLYTSKYIISNSRMPLPWHKRSKQIYLQTWHGTPLKRLVYDLEKVDMALTNDVNEYHKIFSKDVRRWDYLLSTCPFTTEKFESAFRFDKKIIEAGFPRNDKLYNYTDKYIEEIKLKLKIPLDKKVLFYAPTYRDNQNTGVGKYFHTSELDTQRIIKEFKNYVIIIRYHYIITKIENIFNKDVINVTKYPDISDLYLISDLLVTDYSSVMFDFSILRRPFLLYTYDLEDYRDNLRGFYLDIENDFPTKPVSTTTALMKQMHQLDQYNFKEFSDKYNPVTNKNSVEQIINEIF